MKSRAAVLIVVYLVWSFFFKISRLCNSTAFFCRSALEMYKNAEKTISQESTPLRTIFSGASGRTGGSLSVPGLWLRRLSVKAFALTGPVKGWVCAWLRVRVRVVRVFSPLDSGSKDFLAQSINRRRRSLDLLGKTNYPTHAIESTASKETRPHAALKVSTIRRDSNQASTVCLAAPSASWESLGVADRIESVYGLIGWLVG